MSGVLRDTLHPPRATRFLAAHPGNLDSDLLQPFIDAVWPDLIGRLALPIQVVETETVRHVTFLDAIRYQIDRREGTVSIATREHPLSGRDFAPQYFPIAVDPPLATSGWLPYFLNHWREPMGAVLIDHELPGVCWMTTVQTLFWQALRRSTYWKRLRYALREALGLDPKILSWCRQGRSRHLNRHVTDRQFNRTVSHRETYAQIEQDNPNLIWLYTLILDEDYNFPEGDGVAALKTFLAGGKVTPAGWRMLTHSRERDFRHIRDWIGPAGETRGRIFELPSWLRVLVALRRKTPFAPAIQRLFLHDSFNTSAQGQIRFRNVWLDLPVVKIILEEAERRLARGSLPDFVQDALVDVMTWLEAAQPHFDKNQLKTGWKHLVTRAVQWQVDAEAADALRELHWRSVLPTTTIGAYTVVPIETAWRLRQEAMRQHHCADRYLRECLVGESRLFSVVNRNGHPVATIGIERKGRTWQSFGIRAACNRPVARELAGLDLQIAARYTDLWRLSQPVPPVRPTPVTRGMPSYGEREDPIACPICGSGDEETSCERHAVASYDMFGGSLIGGALGADFDALVSQISVILADALRLGIVDLGLGDAFEAVLSEIRGDVVRGLTIAAAIDNQLGAVKVYLLDVLIEQPEVCRTVWDFPGGAPGTATTYREYWAAEPELAAARLVERITVVEKWIEAITVREYVA
jgi:hypothetical protein